MRIYTRAGDLAFSTFTFPDGQPHFKLETYDLEFRSCTIEMALKSPTDLFMVLLASDVLRKHGYSEVLLDIRYLMGARMDRAIDVCQPFTLEIVARLLNGAGFNKVRILDAHSDVATRLIRNSENVLPFQAVAQAHIATGHAIPIAPDKGAIGRIDKYFLYYAKAEKVRNPSTGNLSGFKILDPTMIMDRPVLIVDDICDGGGTFVGLAKELRKAGAKKVSLYVTHGIFSKGTNLEGIDQIFTTDSYFSRPSSWSVATDKVCTVIPVSMKDIK